MTPEAENRSGSCAEDERRSHGFLEVLPYDACDALNSQRRATVNGSLRFAQWIILFITLGLTSCGPALGSDTTTPEAKPSPTRSEMSEPRSPAAPSQTPRDDSPSPHITPTARHVPSPTAEFWEQHIEGGTLGTIWSLADIRYAERSGRFRLVLEMEETAASVPYYTAELTDASMAPFPGTREPTWGKKRIDMVLSDVYAYDYPLADQLPIELQDNPIVTAVTQLPTYDDARLGFSIWLKGPAAFEVHELTGPGRIVVDVFYP